MVGKVVKRGDNAYATYYSDWNNELLVPELTDEQMVDADTLRELRNKFTGESRQTSTLYKLNSKEWISNVEKELLYDYSIDNVIAGKSGVKYEIDNSNGNVNRSDAYGVVTDYKYHGDGEVLSKQVFGGNKVSFLEYQYGVVKEEYSEADDASIVREFWPDGNVKTEKDRESNLTYFEWDSLSRIKKIDFPKDGSESVNIQYDFLNRSKDLGRGRYNTLTKYDGFGRVIESSSEGVVVTYKYDSEGRRYFVSDPNSAAGTTTTYDGLGRVVKELYERDESFTVYEYSSIQDKVVVTNSIGDHVNIYYHNYSGPDENLISKIETMEGVTTDIFRYFNGAPHTIKQGGVSRIYYLNENNQLYKERNPEYGYKYYGYEYASGLLASSFYGRNDEYSNKIYHFYDSKDRLAYTTEEYLRLNDEPKKDWVEYKYDKNDRITTIGVFDDGEAESTVEFGFDQNGNLINEKTSLGNAFGIKEGKIFSIDYVYDENDYLASMTFPSGMSVEYNPDDLGRAVTVGRYVRDVTYHDNSLINELIYGNARKITYTPDEINPNRISDISIPGVLSLHYEYDSVSNVTAITDSIKPSFSVGPIIYDNDGRIKSVSGGWGNASFSYNKRNEFKFKKIGTKSYFYTYGDEIASPSSDFEFISALLKVHGQKDIDFSYGLRGEVLEDEKFSYQYNWKGELLSVTDTSNDELVSQYIYDGNGNRLVEEVSGVQNYFVYDGNGRLVYEVDSDNATAKDYLYLNGQLMVSLAENISMDLVGRDMDFDGVPDGLEPLIGLDNRIPDGDKDSDHDLLSNWDEYKGITSPFNSDTDSDGMLDGQELLSGFDPNKIDEDNDLIPDGWEYQYGLTIGMDDRIIDSNSNGISNYQEWVMGNNPISQAAVVVGEKVGTCSLDVGDSLLINTELQYQQPALDSDNNVYVVKSYVSEWTGNVYKSFLKKYEFRSFIAGCGEVKWSEPIPFNSSAPTVDKKGRIVLSSKDSLSVFSSDGEMVLNVDYDGVVGSVAIDESNNYYFGISTGQFVSLDDEGNERWVIDGYSHAEGLKSRSKTPPAIGANGAVYFSGDYELTSVTLGGEVNWVVPLEGAVVDNPVLDVDGSLFVSTSDKVYQVLPNGKSRVFVAPEPEGEYKKTPVLQMSPVLGEDLVVISSNDFVWAHDRKGKLLWKQKLAYKEDIRYPAIGGDNMVYIPPGIAMNSEGVIAWSTANSKYTGAYAGVILTDQLALFPYYYYGPKVDVVFIGNQASNISGWPQFGKNKQNSGGGAASCENGDINANDIDDCIEHWHDLHDGNLDEDNDGDGLTNREEAKYGSPIDIKDFDYDGLTDFEEKAIETDPYNNDSDEDGMDDLYESASGLEPTKDDALNDLDGDGVNNISEYHAGTNPNDSEDSSSPEVGELLWEIPLFDASSTGYVSLPALSPDEKILYVLMKNDSDVCLQAVGVEGRKLWNKCVENADLMNFDPVYVHPVVMSTGTILVSLKDLYAFSPSGDILWTYPLGRNKKNMSSPALAVDDSIFVSAGDTDDRSYITKLSPEGSVVWVSPVDNVYEDGGAVKYSISVVENGNVLASGPTYSHYFTSDGVLISASYPPIGTGRDYALPLAGMVDGTLSKFDEHPLSHVIGRDKRSSKKFDEKGVKRSPVVDLKGRYIGNDGGVYFIPDFGSSYFENRVSFIEGVNDVSVIDRFNSVTWGSTDKRGSITIGSDNSVYATSKTLLVVFDENGEAEWEYEGERLEYPTLLSNSMLIVIDNNKLKAIRSDGDVLADSAWPAIFHDNRRTSNSSVNVNVDLEGHRPNVSFNDRTPLITFPRVAYYNVSVSANAYDDENGTLTEAVQLYSDIDGFIESELSPGLHRIAARVTDSDNRSAVKTYAHLVREKKTAIYIEKPYKTRAISGIGRTFFAVATRYTNCGDIYDNCYTDVSDEIRWHTDKDGYLGQGYEKLLTLRTPGIHRVTAVYENDDEIVSDSIIVNVEDIGYQAINEIIVTSPGDSSHFNSGDTISFIGVALSGDVDSSVSLEWYDQTNRQLLGGGGLFETNELAAGKHRICARVNYSDIGWKNNCFDVFVDQLNGVNSPPTLAFSSPLNGAVFEYGQLISFSVNKTDTEDGVLVGGSNSAGFDFYSSIDGILKEGNIRKFNEGYYLSVGVHTLSVESYDSGGLKGEASIQVVVTAPEAATVPSLEITSPALSQTQFSVNSDVLFEAMSMDKGGVDISNNIQWTSSLQGVLGVGGQLAINTLTVGEHQIVAVVSDAAGKTSTLSRLVFIFDSVITNKRPYLEVDYPINGAIFDSGEDIPVSGQAIDEEDGSLTTEIVWSIEGRVWAIGGDGIIKKHTLNVGDNVLIASVEDSVGVRSIISRTIHIVKEEPVRPENTPPHVLITSWNSGETIAQGVLFILSGSASDEIDGDLSENILWSSSLDGVLGVGGDFAIESLTIGTHIITAEVMDGGGLFHADAKWLLVNPGIPTRNDVVIVYPEDDAEFLAGNYVRLIGGGALNQQISWWSSLDGALGDGETLNTNTLSVGAHYITASATGPEGSLHKQTTQLHILAGVENNSPPAVVVDTPKLGDELIRGSDILLSGNAFDIEDGDIADSIYWYSSKEGLLGTGKTLTVQLTSLGEHDLWIQIVDSVGNKGSHHLKITVVEPKIENNAPTIDIVEPAQNQVYVQHTVIEMKADTSDVETHWNDLAKGVLWYSSVDGYLGSGSKLQVMDLSVGEHVVAATVEDDDGYRVTQTRIITVKPIDADLTVPQLNILKPSRITEIELGKEIAFSASAVDVEDGDISSMISWKSSLKGGLGVGSTLTTGALSLGVHTITASVTDTDGLSQQARVTVSVVEAQVANNQPVLTIHSPMNNQGFLVGEGVPLYATATDEEDGDITENIHWTSSLSGILGSGGTLTVNQLSEGSHVITASVTDSGGLNYDQVVSVKVNPVVQENQAPVVTIQTPFNNAVSNQGVDITFAATAADTEDGSISTQIVWSSSEDGALGVGGSISLSNLTVGVHVISASVVDSGGVPDMKTISLTINAVVQENQAPVVALQSPVDNSVRKEGVDITLTATAIDVEDGDVSALVVWKSSRDGELGVGGSLTLNNLSVGVHAITASVVDSEGLPGEDVISVTIEQNVAVSPDLMVEMVGENGKWKKDVPNIVFYTLVTNTGEVTAENVMLDFVYPFADDSTLSVHSISTGQGECQPDSVTCALGNLEPQQVVRINITMLQEKSAWHDYHANVSSDTVDSDNDNDTVKERFGGALGVYLFGLLVLLIARRFSLYVNTRYL